MAQPDALKRRRWLDEQAERLLNGGLEQVVQSVQAFTLPCPKARKEQQNLVNYLLENDYRMKYQEYIENGLFIGSGAIESAHRTVVQCRLKRSSQRWSQSGAQNVLNLRVAYRATNGTKSSISSNIRPLRLLERQFEMHP